MCVCVESVVGMEYVLSKGDPYGDGWSMKRRRVLGRKMGCKVKMRHIWCNGVNMGLKGSCWSRK